MLGLLLIILYDNFINHNTDQQNTEHNYVDLIAKSGHNIKLEVADKILHTISYSHEWTLSAYGASISELELES